MTSVDQPTSKIPAFGTRIWDLSPHYSRIEF